MFGVSLLVQNTELHFLLPPKNYQYFLQGRWTIVQNHTFRFDVLFLSSLGSKVYIDGYDVSLLSLRTTGPSFYLLEYLKSSLDSNSQNATGRC